MAIPAVDEEHQQVRLAIDKFDEGVKVRTQTGEGACYCVKYCRKCELACPVGMEGVGLNN